MEQITCRHESGGGWLKTGGLYPSSPCPQSKAATLWKRFSPSVCKNVQPCQLQLRRA